MIKPDDLESEAGQLTWDSLVAAAEGNVVGLRRLLERNPRLAAAEYWYTPAIHFAAREGRLDAVKLLLDAGADPEWNGLHDGSLIQMANEQGHTAIVRLLEQTRDRRGIIPIQPAESDYRDTTLRKAAAVRSGPFRPRRDRAAAAGSRCRSEVGGADGAARVIPARRGPCRKPVARGAAARARR